MSASDAACLDLAELDRLLRDADPAALLVPPRLLRRVIKRERKLTSIGLRVPHYKCYVVASDTLLALADRGELGVEPHRELPPTLLLLARPESEKLAALPRDQVLIEYWRLLFHARVHQAMGERSKEQRLTPALLRARVHEIGQTEFDEVRTVLRQEKWLLPPRDDRTAYEEFAAVYLELRFFAAARLPHFFPALDDLDRIDGILARDVDASTLFAATRLAGAPEPISSMEDSESSSCRTDFQSVPPDGTDWKSVLRPASAAECPHLMARADRAAAAGNVVRAALCRAQAARAAPPELAGAVQARARADLDRLVERLQAALHLEDAEVEAWRQALPALLPAAACGAWPAEARLLYDLQKVCVDHERPLYKPDLVEWAYSLFRQPLVRPLPHQPLVLAVKHLRGAVHRLPAVRVAEPQRQALSTLLHDALHNAEQRLRDRFRPLLQEVLAEVGLRPRNFPERVARDKLVEELLDRITERGFLNLGDIRDALSRNDLKLPELAGPGELLAGDPLLRANRKLAERAPGVYRRSEVYLRGLQRASALAFGTPLGRWLTLFVALPLGAGYGTVAIVQELLHLLEKVHLTHVPHLEPMPLAGPVGVLWVFFLLLLHSAAFRSGMLRGLRAAGRAARAVVIDLPAAVLRLPLVRRLLDSWPFLFFARYVLKPLPIGLLAAVALWGCGAGLGIAAAGGAVVFVGLSLLLNSRLGRDLEEVTTDWTVRKWEYLQDLVPGLFRLVMDLSRQFLGAMERYLYTVDEWLRFRPGQGRLALAAKTVLGFVWFLASYAVRVFIVVFVEPWVNPIKHFPAVTVAAKLLLPFMIPLIDSFSAPLMFLSAPVAYALAFVLVKAIPGAAGFLAWELQENWRLYEANRPEQLRPIVVGHHGETVLRLMKPGLHSGTLPKLYAKLRRAERKARRGGIWRSARRLREELYEIEEPVGRFAERELLALLDGGQGWRAGPVHLAAVEVASNRIRLALACPALGEGNLELQFEEQSGWLLASVSSPGWLPRLSEDSVMVLTRALTGFYKKAGVDLIREQLAACLGPKDTPYDLADEGLVVWPGGGYEATIVYDLHEGPVLHPRIVEGKPAVEPSVLHAEQLLFRDRPVTWREWVEAWERGAGGEGDSKPLVPGVRLLPPAQ